MTVRTMKIVVRAMNSKIEHKKKSEKLNTKKIKKNRTTKIKEREKEIILTLAFDIKDLR